MSVSRREMLKPVPTKAFLQPAKAAAMYTALRAETHPPPPTPPFFLAQNLSSKRIAPTDNMRPKLHDEYLADGVKPYCNQYKTRWCHLSLPPTQWPGLASPGTL